MSYQIYKSDGSLLSTIQDYTTDTSSTSLSLLGRGVSNFGSAIAMDFVHLLENFRNSSPPANPIEGQLWYQTYDATDPNNPIDVNKLFFYSGEEWILLSSVETGTTPPQEPKLGDFWLNPGDLQMYFWNGTNWSRTSNAQSTDTNPTDPVNGTPENGTVWFMMPEGMLWVYDTSLTSPQPAFVRQGGANAGKALTGGWRLVGPEAPSSKNVSTYYTQVTDTTGNLHDISVVQCNGEPLGIWSATEFDMDLTKSNAVLNFTSINAQNTASNSGTAHIFCGLTLNSSAPAVIGGKAISADYITGMAKDDFIGRGIDTTATPTWPISDNKITLGTSGNRWSEIYGATFYGGSSTPSTLDVSKVNFVGRASTGDKFTNNLTIASPSTSDVSGTVTFNGSEGSINAPLSITNTGFSHIQSWLQTSGILAAGPVYKNGSTTGYSGNMGTTTDHFNVIYSNTFDGTATSADYADLAERYEADQEYSPGTVVKIGGDKEITQTISRKDIRVFGVISTNPGYLMNKSAGTDETHPPVALNGRVPVNVVGPISKGDFIISSNIPGAAERCSDDEAETIPAMCIIGRALETNDSSDEKLVECYIGK